MSSDWGATFKALPSPGDTEGYGQELRLHPRQPDWVLARVRRNACHADRRRSVCLRACGRVCACLCACACAVIVLLGAAREEARLHG